MKQPVETDPVLAFVDTLLNDLAVRSPTYVARRAEDGDQTTFVLQIGEGGCFRLALPDLENPDSVEQLARAAQTHLERVLDLRAPPCPLHSHALVLRAHGSTVAWTCPEAQWSCTLGDYDERAWPPASGPSLAPILTRRLGRRNVAGVSTIGVRDGHDGPVARFGLAQITPELIHQLQDAAAPFPIEVHHEPHRFIRGLTSRQPAES